MKKYAVLIGNSEFPDEPQLTQLRCPENDVTGMQEILAHRDLGGFNTVVPVINKALPEIIEEIHGVLNKAGKQDLVALYYSGHGKVSSKTSQLYLTAKNTRFASLPVTALAINQIRELIGESDCNKVVLFLDCCYAGKAGNHKADIDSLLLTNTRGFYTLAASTGLQTSIEKEGDDYGLFTKYLIHGIKSGEADENGNGEITVDELYNYVYKKVLSENPNQVPTKSASDGRGELIISKSGRGSRKEKADKIKHYFIDLFKTDAIEIDILQDVSTLVYKLPQEFSANERQRYDLFVEVFESKKLAGFDRKWDRLFTQDLTGFKNLSGLNASPKPAKVEQNLAIGQRYQGGIIFYLDDSCQHGLIAALTDQSTGIQWYNGSYLEIDGTSTAIGTGKANTAKIIERQGTGNYAAFICANLEIEGYKDWFLPSKDELNLMYNTIGQGASGALKNGGGFVSYTYWSSSGYDYLAWSQYFYDGAQYNVNKNSSLYVRAVRAF